ncbi:hypothetical protein L486_00098 [Kwoniella mangroviensis CBS 10435]|uniref:Amidase domain-containing protein n=1 Tax=Kwoniella mangroviensis CBS 10435 TaxID=1331196 RepID=A0A1B9IY49_9TREE|nr:hypothetical protein L486_00098 [Kwoniella mangroviensis CBS 10435]
MSLIETTLGTFKPEPELFYHIDGMPYFTPYHHPLRTLPHIPGLKDDSQFQSITIISLPPTPGVPVNRKILDKVIRTYLHENDVLSPGLMRNIVHRSQNHGTGLVLEDKLGWPFPEITGSYLYRTENGDLKTGLYPVYRLYPDTSKAFLLGCYAVHDGLGGYSMLNKVDGDGNLMIVGVKDIFDVEGLPTKAGSRVFAHLNGRFQKQETAPSLKIHEEAGAVIVGKVKTSHKSALSISLRAAKMNVKKVNISEIVATKVEILGEDEITKAIGASQWKDFGKGIYERYQSRHEGRLPPLGHRVRESSKVAQQEEWDEEKFRRMKEKFGKAGKWFLDLLEWNDVDEASCFPLGSYVPASIGGFPHLVIPVGQVPFHSLSSQRMEMQTICASLVGPPGTDLSIIGVLLRLKEEGVIKDVQTGGEAFKHQGAALLDENPAT